MEAGQFDQMARGVVTGPSRRRIAGALGGLALAPLVDRVIGRAKKRKTKKKPLCLNGQTVKVSGKKRKKLIKQGATPGACAAGCTPQCGGTSCGPDGCGGTCACSGNTVCDQGTCVACTVVCGGESAGACGTRLAQALVGGGKITVCPGRYLGSFTVGVSNTVLIGAGSGNNAASSTILTGIDNQRVLLVPGGVTTFLSRLQITGGDAQGVPGGGVRGDAGSTISMDECAVVENQTLNYGSGISSAGRLTLTRSTVSGNGKVQSLGGGGIALTNGPHLIENSVISGNECNYAGPGGKTGGGLHCSASATVDIRGTEIRDNFSEGEGGGIWVANSTVSLDAASRVVNNAAGFPNGGGGIYRQSGNVLVGSGVVSGNTPDQCAGSLFSCPS